MGCPPGPCWHLAGGLGWGTEAGHQVINQGAQALAVYLAVITHVPPEVQLGQGLGWVSQLALGLSQELGGSHLEASGLLGLCLALIPGLGQGLVCIGHVGLLHLGQVSLSLAPGPPLSIQAGLHLG